MRRRASIGCSWWISSRQSKGSDSTVSRVGHKENSAISIFWVAGSDGFKGGPQENVHHNHGIWVSGFVGLWPRLLDFCESTRGLHPSQRHLVDSRIKTSHKILPVNLFCHSWDGFTVGVTTELVHWSRREFPPAPRLGRSTPFYILHPMSICKEGSVFSIFKGWR